MSRAKQPQLFPGRRRFVLVAMGLHPDMRVRVLQTRVCSYGILVGEPL